MNRVVYLPVATAVECDHGVPLRADAGEGCARCATDWGITDYYERRRADARKLAGVRCRKCGTNGAHYCPADVARS